MTADVDRLNSALAGRYTIQRELGAGGMATVYLAHDMRHDRDVAMKVLHPDLGAALGGDRFLTEIKTTARLQHPHILPLLDSGDADGLLYYVMPYVTGETLRSCLEREHQLPIEDAVRIAREIADALGAAHALGIIHRDIKPENVLLQGGHALVADFGIALAVQHAAGQRMTQTGLSLGTPQYMSPEQAMGEKNIDLRTDIYALGAVTYEMLAGDPPFTGSSVQAIVAKTMNERPSPLHTVRDTVPAGVENAVLKALAKLPADRFATANAFGDALSAGMTTATSTSVARNVKLDSARRPGTPRAWWVVAATLLAINASGLAWFSRHQRAPAALVMQRQLTFEGKAVGAAISRDGLWLAYVQDECQFADAPQCSFTLSVREVDGSQGVRIANMPSIDPEVQWSGDGKTVIFRGSNGGASRVFVADRLGGSPHQIPVSPTAMTVLADGTSLLTADGRTNQWLRRWDIATLAALDSTPAPPDRRIISLATSSRDGTLAAVASSSTGNDQIVLLTPAGRLLDSMTVPLRGTVRWAPDGNAIVAYDDGESGGGDDLLQISVKSRHMARSHFTMLFGQVVGDGQFDVSLTSRYALVVKQQRSDFQVASLAEPGLRWRSITERSGILAHRISFTPSGGGLLVGAQDNLGENLQVFDIDGGATHALTTYRGLATTGGRWAESADYSPDGTRILYTRGNGANVDIAQIDSAGGRDRVLVPRSPGNVPKWMDDGHFVLLRRGYVMLVDTSGVTRDSVMIPDSLALDDRRFQLNRPERSVYFSVPASRTIVAADFRAHVVRLVTRMPEAMYAAGWNASGQLLLATRTNGSSTSFIRAVTGRLVRLDPASGALIPVGALPRGCSSAVVDRRGLQVACRTVTGGGDVWLATPAQP